MDDDELGEIYVSTKTIAVVGASSDTSKPGHRIPRYLQSQGFRVIPVSPKGGEIFGESVYTSLKEVDVPVDVVDVFRPAEEAPAIAQDAVAIGAKVLWLQTGIVSADAAEIARAEGLKVVMNTCMGETHARLGLGPGP
jgi:predicted CoA-binding protein